MLDSNSNVLNEGKSVTISAAGDAAITVCGTEVATSTAAVTVRLQLAASTSTAAIVNGTAAGSSAIDWDITAKDAPMPTPFIAGFAPGADYWQGYTNKSQSWATSSGTYTDATNTGGNAITKRIGTVAVTAPASNYLGITWTPANAAAVYEVTAMFNYETNTAVSEDVSFRLYDGTVVISENGTYQNSTAATGISTISGIYAPGTTSAVTVRMQMGISGGNTLTIGSNGIAGQNSNVEWTLKRIL